jgi:uncharacterized protein (TIGR03066 family)
MEVVVRILLVLAFCVVALSLSGPGRADESKASGRPETESPGQDKKPDAASLLVGKWQGTGKFAGVTLEYAKDGTCTSTAVLNRGAKPTVVSGTWKIKGDQLVQTLGQIKAPVTITRLTEKEFRFTNNAGPEATYERAAEKK